MFRIAERFRLKNRYLVLLVLMAAFVWFIIGPFTFYASLWPHLSGVLPRPEVVPEGARAGHHWKASGTYWEWQDDLPSGCASWSTGGDDVSYISLTLAAGPDGCQNAKEGFDFSYAVTPYVSLWRTGSRSGPSHCSRHTADLTASEAAELNKLIKETKAVAKTRGERLMVAYAELFMMQPEPLPGEHPCGDRYKKLKENVEKAEPGN